MPSPLLKKNFQAIYQDLFMTPQERKWNKDGGLGIYLPEPTCMSAFEWPVSKPFSIYRRRRETLYVLLPQDLDLHLKRRMRLDAPGRV